MLNPYSNGIGLYISKQICKNLDGIITVKSAPNKGSSFVFIMKVFKVTNLNVDDRLSSIIEEEKIDVENEGEEESSEDESHFHDLAFLIEQNQIVASKQE